MIFYAIFLEDIVRMVYGHKLQLHFKVVKVIIGPLTISYTRPAEITSDCTLLFRELLASAKLEEEEEKQLRLTCVALYVEVLLKFLRLKDRDLKNALQDCPAKVRNHIFHKYTEMVNQKRIRNREAADRAMVCLLILAFIVNKYQLSVSALLQSINIDRNRLEVVMRVIGASHIWNGISYKLQLPLARVAKQYVGKKQKK
ncbi:uncharacterized protein LOC134771447 [Penaeus indicus]|uniref:uncharacterized protein LOC134771447 n=1 Tax=Penaeus indicus TaxID=29960 RepID=UPI00300C1E1D